MEPTRIKFVVPRIVAGRPKAKKVNLHAPGLRRPSLYLVLRVPPPLALRDLNPSDTRVDLAAPTGRG